jgi:hypothetical protein
VGPPPKFLDERPAEKSEVWMPMPIRKIHDLNVIVQRADDGQSDGEIVVAHERHRVGLPDYRLAVDLVDAWDHLGRLSSERPALKTMRLKSVLDGIAVNGYTVRQCSEAFAVISVALKLAVEPARLYRKLFVDADLFTAPDAAMRLACAPT